MRSEGVHSAVARPHSSKGVNRRVLPPLAEALIGVFELQANSRKSHGYNFLCGQRLCTSKRRVGGCPSQAPMSSTAVITEGAISRARFGVVPSSAAMQPSPS